ncbi:hypothetical protein P7C71_g612, partial [Lecanoromycetidae sp. Uapishka_2]
MAFNLLALEINENIASYLDHDRDVNNFGFTCKTTYAAVNEHRCGLWRKLWKKRYDLPPGKSGVEIMMQYKVRSRFLRKRIPNFVMGQEFTELRAIDRLRELIIESYADTPMGQKATTVSKNIAEIRRFVQRSSIFSSAVCPFREEPNYNPALKTLQIVLFHLQLDRSLDVGMLGFPFSQSAVYAHPQQNPLFLNHGLDVNIDLLMHTANFFKYHMTQATENTLYTIFNELEDDQKPRAWESQLQQGRGIPGVKKLGTHWKGSYAYLDPSDMPYIRSTDDVSIYDFVDRIDYEDGFQTLELDFSSPASNVTYPQIFDKHLNSFPSPQLCKEIHRISKPKKRVQAPARTHHYRRPAVHSRDTGLPSPKYTPDNPPRQHVIRLPASIHPTAASDLPPTPTSPVFDTSKPRKGHNYLQFGGSGADALRFHCNGILHPLPPQHEIPGWQRITMMKYFDDVSPNSSPAGAGSDNSSASKGFQLDDDVSLNDGCWAYEGVVLPGGMIILGRWWSPMDQTRKRCCMGPFIFWNVAPPAGETP